MTGASTVTDRVEALAQALTAGGDALPAELSGQGWSLVARARERLALAGETTVVALAGATGSGKSSLFNALAGADLATPGTLRPTTGAAEAAIWAADASAAHGLLDWLQVGRRHVLAVPSTGAVATDLVLLDLPDHDSVEVAHRAVAERLYHRVDLLVWVVDPQKYADAVLHERYLRPLAALAGAMVLVLNQADRLATAEQQACLADLRRLAAADGLPDVPLLAVSARSGEGVPALRDLLAGAAARRRAAADRLGAEVGACARRLVAACGPAGPATGRVAVDGLLAALEVAAGVPVVVEAVRRSQARAARTATGWPPLRWLARLVPDPLRRLHLAVGAPGTTPSRTSLPPPTPATAAVVSAAVRAYVHEATAGAPDDWVLAVRARVAATGLAPALDVAVAATPLAPARPAAWWRAANALQWLALGILAAGLAWHLALVVVERALLASVSVPHWRALPVPTWLALGGLLLALLVAGLGGLLGALGARRRAARAGRRLHAAVAQVAHDQVVAPVQAELDTLARCRAAAQRAIG